MKRIVISGYYGFDNIGDEAVLGGLLAGLRHSLPHITPVVLSANPERTTELHGVAAISRMNAGVLREELRQCALLLSGGGSLLQDVTSFRSPLYYLWVLWEAQRAKVPTMMVGQGVGPLRNPIIRLLTRLVLNRLRSVTVRDAVSAALLQTIGVCKPPIEVTADLSFLLAPNLSSRVTDWWSTHIPTDRPVIGVALRRWNTTNAETQYTALVDGLAEFADKSGALLLFLPMQYPTDLHIAEEMSSWTPAENVVLDMALSPGEMLALIARCNFILAMRLHALIFAVHQAVPALGISYDPKVTDFSRAAKIPLPLVWGELVADKLAEQLNQHWTARDSLKSLQIQSAVNLTTLAQWNITRIAEIINSE